MDLIEIVQIAKVLNSGEKAYTHNINTCYDVVRWYKEHGTTVKFKQEGDSICMWKEDNSHNPVCTCCDTPYHEHKDGTFERICNC